MISNSLKRLESGFHVRFLKPLLKINNLLLPIAQFQWIPGSKNVQPSRPFLGPARVVGFIFAQSHYEI